jgi:hypothetical protein
MNFLNAWLSMNQFVGAGHARDHFRNRGHGPLLQAD